MEDLEQQTQIINLGKLLVHELGIENSSDTLSRWMAHYIAEKLLLIERIDSGKEKETSEKECFKTILQLWKHRWQLPSGKRPLENFEPILKVLEKINPDKEDSFFYHLSDHELSEICNSANKEIKVYINSVIQIDKVARIWIEYFLNQAAFKVKDEYTEIILKNGINLSDNEDLRIIQFILDNDSTLSKEKDDKDGYDKQYQIKKLNKRIMELEKFSTINNFLLDSYKNALLNLQDSH